MRYIWDVEVGGSNPSAPTTFGSWCNGSTADFDSASRGSSPCEPARFMINKYLIRLAQILFLSVVIPMAISVMVTTILIFSVGLAVVFLMLLSVIF